MTRRTTLKKFGSAVGAATALGASVPTVTADEMEKGVTAFEEFSWKKTDMHTHSRFYSLSYDEDYSVTSTLRNHGGAPASDGTWQFVFELESYGAVRRHEYNKDPDTGFKVDRIGYQWLSVNDNDNSDATVYFTDAPEHTGGTPAEGVTALEVAEAVFKNVAEETVGALSDRISGVLTAADIWQDILAEWSETNNFDDGEEIAWTYADGWAGPSHSDVNHFGKWHYNMQNANDTAIHFAKSEIAPDGKGFFDSIEWQIECDSPDSWSTNTLSSTTTTSGVDRAADFDPSYKEQVGLHPVPVDMLASAGFDTDALVGVPGKPDLAWWASDLNVGATARGQTKQKR